MEELEWEPIHSPTSAATHSDEDDGDAVVVNKPSIFPPTNHEGLPPDHHFQEPTSTTSYSSSASSSSGVDESELPSKSKGVKAGLGILRIAFWMRSRIGFWSMAAAAAVVAVAVYGRRWRRRVEKENRDQLVLLVNQKDEKIKQLLVQIDRMKGILSARTSVPVHRIVVDRPLVNKQRSNWKPS